MYEAQKASRARKLQQGWKRVEAFLDPPTAKEWAELAPQYNGSPTELIKAAITALKERNA